MSDFHLSSLDILMTKVELQTHLSIFENICEHGDQQQVMDYLKTNLITYEKSFLNRGLFCAYQSANLEVIQYLISLGADAPYNTSWKKVLPNVIINRARHIQVARFVIDHYCSANPMESKAYQMCLDGDDNCDVNEYLSKSGRIDTYDSLTNCLWFSFVGDHRENVLIMLRLIRLKYYRSVCRYDKLLIIEYLYGQHYFLQCLSSQLSSECLTVFFLWACRYGHLIAVQRLNTCFPISNLSNGLFLSCKFNHYHIVQSLLKIDHPDLHCLCFPMQVACQYGHIKVVDMLVQHLQKSNDDKPLFYFYGFVGAVQGGHIDLVERMIAKGVNDWSRGLIWACKSCQRHLIDFFLDKGINNWDLVFKNVCKCDQIAIVQQCLMPNNKKKLTSLLPGLMSAVSVCHPEVVQLIIDHEIKNPTILFEYWILALDEASHKIDYPKSTAVIRLILKHLKMNFPQQCVFLKLCSSSLKSMLHSSYSYYDRLSLDLIEELFRFGARVSPSSPSSLIIRPLLDRLIPFDWMDIHPKWHQTITKKRKQKQLSILLTLSPFVSRHMIHVIILPCVSFSSHFDAIK